MITVQFVEYIGGGEYVVASEKFDSLELATRFADDCGGWLS